MHSLHLFLLAHFDLIFRLAEKKQEQDRKLKERLEERKKRKEKEFAGPVEVDFGEIDSCRVSRTDKQEPRPISRPDRHRADRDHRNGYTDKRERDSSKERKKNTKIDKNSVYDFGDF